MASALQGFEQRRRRTPLRAIRGELEGMMDGLIPTTKEGLQSLHEEAGRLRLMLDGLEDPGARRRAP